MKRALQKFHCSWLYTQGALLLAGIAWCVSVAQSLIYLHRLETNLDEGAYLLKGFLFATGKYIPYQEYGVWTNHMPLAFLIPGWIQRLLWPGLEVGRFFMVVVFGISLIGLWLTARRFSGAWGATAALWLVALNPVLIKMYSTAVSQGLTACLVAWVLALGVGGKRPAWQILLASFLASVTTLVRINLLPVLVFLVVYIFWQYGWRIGLWSLLTATVPLIGAHWFFWPNILQIYVRWVPRGFSPLLDAWRLEKGSIGIWHPDLTLIHRLVSFFRTIRFHFALLLSASAAIMIWQKRLFQKDQFRWKALVFLFVLFWSLFAAHAWVTLRGDYCNYCLEGYLAFFAPSGIVLGVASLPYWRKTWQTWINILLVLGVGVIGGGIGLALADDVRYGLLYIPLPRFLLDFPRWGRGTFLPIEVLSNVFSSLTDRQAHFVDLILSGVILGWLFTLLVWLGLRLGNRHLNSKVSFGYALLTGLMIFGFLFAPSALFSGGRYTYDCTPETLSNYQKIGKQLAQLIPPGSQVYWQSMAATPLLYVPNVRIYPPQINDIYSFYANGQDDALLRLGLWNESLARRWLAEADVIVVEELYLKDFVRQVLKSGDYQLITILPSLSVCRPKSQLRVYKPIH